MNIEPDPIPLLLTIGELNQQTRVAPVYLGGAIVGEFPIPIADHMWRTVKCFLNGSEERVWNYDDAISRIVYLVSEAVGRKKIELSEEIKANLTKQLKEELSDGDPPRWWTRHLEFLLDPTKPYPGAKND